MKRRFLSLAIAVALLLPVAAAQPRAVSSDTPPPSGSAEGSASSFDGIRVLSVGIANVPIDPTDPFRPSAWSDLSADSDGDWSLTGSERCYRVRMSTPAGTPMSTLAALVTPSVQLNSIWRFNDRTKQQDVGYLSLTGAPLDFTQTIGGEEFYLFCIRPPARIGLPRPLVTGGGTLVPATISLSSPTVTVGNSVTVSGSVFPPNDGPVSLAYNYSMNNPNGGQSGGSGTLGSATISGQGTFSTSITLPSSVPPASVTISAQSKSAQATATLQVVAPSSKGTLTVTWAGLVYTSIGTDSPFTLNGVNFTQGPVTIYLDSPTGLQLGTATVGADGTFQKDLQVNADQIGNRGGQHKLVVVQNGTVQAEGTYPFELPEVIH